jgi:hypothetical protein
LSKLANWQGWHPDVIELQLAHAERNESRRAYNRAVSDLLRPLCLVACQGHRLSAR